MRLRLLLVLCLLGCVHPPAQAPRPGPHVYLVIVDGLDPRLVTPAHMPRLFSLLAAAPERSSFFPAAQAVMPTRTNPNHVTLLTGVYAEVHGVTGNAWWSRERGAPPQKLDAAALIEVETLFTVAATARPAVVTLGVFGKPKLARLFATVPGRQHAPDVLWSGADLPAARREPATGYASDAETVAAAVERSAGREPDLAVLNLSDVDSAGHGHGPDGPEYARAVAGADAALGALADELHARGRWERSVLIVTADHAMESVAPTAEQPRPSISLGETLAGAGAVTVADGGVEHVYASDGADLRRAAALAAAAPGVAEILARVAVPGVPALAARHPDWHLDHERAGDLLLVAAPGFQFVDPYDAADAALRGNHGGPGQRGVPLVVTGGWPGLAHASGGAAGLVDVAPTVATLLGLRTPRRVDGSAVPPERAGRPIAAVLAQSPH